MGSVGVGPGNSLSQSPEEQVIGARGEHHGTGRGLGVSISLVIPALNEAANLPHVLTRIPAMVDEVLLVDGHSVDDTVSVAQAILPGIRILLQPGAGKGTALACGCAAATGDIIVMLDADGSTDPAEIPRFVSALLDGSDFVKGSRYVAGGSSSDITRLRADGNRLLNVAVNVLFRTRYTDLCYGYNAFWRSCLPHLRLTVSGFEVETLMHIRVARAGLRVTEVPSVESARMFGESKLNAARDGLRVLSVIVRERLRPRPRHLDRYESWQPRFRELASPVGRETAEPAGEPQRS
jgi:glycosyltransferase involved in cell wall biosynthesis